MYIYPIRPDEIYHYGMPRRSGRYPWGSGDRPYQSVKSALKGKNRDEWFTSERTIPKGTRMYRTTTNPQLDLKSSNSIYVTYLEPDRDLYKGGGYIRKRDRSKESYEHEMVLKEDLKIPSREVFKDSIKEVIDDHPELFKESVESFLDMYIPKGSFDRFQIEYAEGDYDPKAWDKFVNKSLSIRKDQDIHEQWGSIAVSLGKADKLKEQIIDNLSTKGYNAIVDEAGVGGNGRAIEGIDPLIIFDPEILTPVNVSQTSSLQENKSRNKYEKWLRSARQKTSKWQ